MKDNTAIKRFRTGWKGGKSYETRLKVLKQAKLAIYVYGFSTIA